MTFPNFSVGETLRAADMNSVGLWLVKSQTVGTGVTSVTVTNCFNADYDNYRIVVSGIDFAIGGFLYYIQLGGKTANYYGSCYVDTYTGAATTTFRSNNSNQLSIGVQDVDNSAFSIDILRPYVSTPTTLHGNHYGGGYSGWLGGIQAENASLTSFTINSGNGTFTGGTIRVYGYRN